MTCNSVLWNRTLITEGARLTLLKKMFWNPHDRSIPNFKRCWSICAQWRGAFSPPAKLSGHHNGKAIFWGVGGMPWGMNSLNNRPAAGAWTPRPGRRRHPPLRATRRGTAAAASPLRATRRATSAPVAGHGFQTCCSSRLDLDHTWTDGPPSAMRKAVFVPCVHSFPTQVFFRSMQ